MRSGEIMGLPSSLSGIVGFLIFVIFIISISASDVYPDQTASITNAQNNFIANFNNSVNTTASTENQGWFDRAMGALGLDGIYSFITNFFSMVVSFIIMVGGYILLFFGIAGTIPSDFYVLFALMGSGLIIAVVKLVFLSGD